MHVGKELTIHTNPIHELRFFDVIILKEPLPVPSGKPPPPSSKLTHDKLSVAYHERPAVAVTVIVQNPPVGLNVALDGDADNDVDV
jgi:hypothetical protein